MFSDGLMLMSEVEVAFAISNITCNYKFVKSTLGMKIQSLILGEGLQSGRSAHAFAART